MYLMDLRPDEITGLIKSRIKNYNAKIQLGDVGTVVTVGDGIVRIHGLEKCMLSTSCSNSRTAYSAWR